MTFKEKFKKVFVDMWGVCLVVLSIFIIFYVVLSDYNCAIGKNCLLTPHLFGIIPIANFNIFLGIALIGVVCLLVIIYLFEKESFGKKLWNYFIEAVFLIFIVIFVREKIYPVILHIFSTNKLNKVYWITIAISIVASMILVVYYKDKIKNMLE